MKKQAVTELNGILSNESTMLSNICRTLLLSILSALAFVPVLNAIYDLTSDLIELWYLYIGLFSIPTLVKFIAYLRYNRKKKRAINNLKTMYLHDAYARVANRIESEINSFYNKMIALADRYIDRCENIRLELSSMEYAVLQLFLEGKSYNEISKQMQITEKSVDNALARIRKKIAAI